MMRVGFVLLASATWWHWWWTADQYGQRRLAARDYVGAAEVFRDPFRQGVALFRAKEFEAAAQAFARVATVEADYNRGCCLILLGKYEAAVETLDQALAQRPDWEDARVNREVAAARLEARQLPGGDMGDQKLGADEIVFDKQKGSGGQDTQVQDQVTSDQAMQALWLRRVQTKPAEFLRSKFAYQLAEQEAAP